MFAGAIVFGTIIGSFCNSVLLRKNTGESALRGGSRCFSCGKRLRWFELVPIVSFFIQRGRCRKCGSKISWHYVLVEFGGGILGALLYLKFPFFIFQASFSFLFYFFAFAALSLVALYDFRHQIIDFYFLYIFGAFAVAEIFTRLNLVKFLRGSISLDIAVFRNDVATAITIFIFFYILWRFSGGRWMGRGDSFLAFFTSLFVGYPLSIVALLLSFWIGAAVGIVLLCAASQRFTIKSVIPFGPFLAIGTFFAWYYNDFFIYLYAFFFS